MTLNSVFCVAPDTLKAAGYQRITIPLDQQPEAGDVRFEDEGVYAVYVASYVEAHSTWGMSIPFSTRDWHDEPVWRAPAVVPVPAEMQVWCERKAHRDCRESEFWESHHGGYREIAGADGRTTVAWVY